MREKSDLLVYQRMGFDAICRPGSLKIPVQLHRNVPDIVSIDYVSTVRS